MIIIGFERHLLRLGAVRKYCFVDTLTTTTTVSTIPNGTVIATQDEGGVHYQEVKLTASGTGTTEALSKAEDAAHTSGEHGILALGIRSDTLGTAARIAGTDGDYIGVQMDAVGATYTRDTWKTPLGDSMADDTNDALKVAIVADAAGGAKATTSLNAITLVADDAAVDVRAGLDGVLITRPFCNLEDAIHERVTNTDGASTALTVAFAATASKRIHVTKAVICNSSASFCTVDLRDGSAGAVLYTIPVPATSGASVTFDVPLRLTANTALAYDVSAAVTTVTLSFSGFKSKV